MHLYKLLNADGETLYVGQTSNVVARMQEHARLRTWWPEVANVETVEVDDAVADLHEQTTIAMLEPKYNRNHNPSRPAATDHGTCRIGYLVAEKRGMAGTSLTDLATQSSVSVPYLAQIEAGLRTPSLPVLVKLADALGCCACELLPEVAAS